VPGVPETLARLKQRGKKVLFISNNASKHRSSYMNKFKKMGIEASMEDVVTSALGSARRAPLDLYGSSARKLSLWICHIPQSCTAHAAGCSGAELPPARGVPRRYFVSRFGKGAKVFVCGTEGLVQEFREAGAHVVEPRYVTNAGGAVGGPPLLAPGELDHDIKAVVAGADWALNHRKVTSPGGSRAVGLRPCLERGARRRGGARVRRRERRQISYAVLCLNNVPGCAHPPPSVSLRIPTCSPTLPAAARGCVLIATNRAPLPPVQSGHVSSIPPYSLDTSRPFPPQVRAHRDEPRPALPRSRRAAVPRCRVPARDPAAPMRAGEWTDLHVSQRRGARALLTENRHARGARGRVVVMKTRARGAGAAATIAPLEVCSGQKAGVEIGKPGPMLLDILAETQVSLRPGRRWGPWSHFRCR